MRLILYAKFIQISAQKYLVYVSLRTWNIIFIVDKFEYTKDKISELQCRNNSETDAIWRHLFFKRAKQKHLELIQKWHFT